MHIEYSKSLSVDERQHIVNEVLRHDRAPVGVGMPRAIGLSARIKDTLVGGVCGRIEKDRLYVEYLWVDSRFRGQGIGSNLLQAVESAARDGGCVESQIETLSRKTARIYLARGYRVMHHLCNYIPGLTLIVMTKELGESHIVEC